MDPTLSLTAPESVEAGQPFTVAVDARDTLGRRVGDPALVASVHRNGKLTIVGFAPAEVLLVAAEGATGVGRFGVIWYRSDGQTMHAAASITIKAPVVVEPPPDVVDPPPPPPPPPDDEAPPPPLVVAIPLTAWRLADGSGETLVTGGVPFAAGELGVGDAEAARVIVGGGEVAANVAVTARHADGSVRLLRLQFAAAGATDAPIAVGLDVAGTVAPMPRTAYQRPAVGSIADSALTDAQLAQIRGMGYPEGFVSRASAAALCATGFFGPILPVGASADPLAATLDQRFLDSADGMWLGWNGSPRKPMQYDHAAVYIRHFARTLDVASLRWGLAMAARYCAAYGTDNVVTSKPEFANLDGAAYAYALVDSATAEHFLNLNLQKCYSRLAEPVGAPDSMWVYDSSQSDMRPAARFFRGALWGALLERPTHGALSWRDQYNDAIGKHLDPRTVAEVWKVDDAGRVSYGTRSTEGATSNFMLGLLLSVHAEARHHGVLDDPTWTRWDAWAQGCLRYLHDTQRGVTIRVVKDAAGNVIERTPTTTIAYNYYSAVTKNGGPSKEVDLNGFFALPFAAHGWPDEARTLLETLTRTPQDGVLGPWISQPGNETSRKVWGEVFHQAAAAAAAILAA